MTLMCYQLPHAAVHCHAKGRVLRTVEECSEGFDYSVRMLSITPVLGSHEIWLAYVLGMWGAAKLHLKGGLGIPQRCSPDTE
jgi:hypothetical protein